MTWTRLDDLWVDGTELAELSYEDRWHYLCLIQFCSRTQRYDGILRVADARRSSDLDDPDAALDRLVAIGLVHRQPDGRVKVGRIDEHIPPPSVRNAADASRVRKQRSRAHKNGDHSMCLPEHCEHTRVDKQTGEVTSPVTPRVTRDTGTGQDGTGQAPSRGKGSKETVTRDRTTPSSSEPCFSCGLRPAVNGSDCLECSSGGVDLQHQSVSDPAPPELAETPASPPPTHRAPAVPPSCAYSGCPSAPRPGKQMCQLHFTYEPSGRSAA